jgi:hypothetical protein
MNTYCGLEYGVAKAMSDVYLGVQQQIWNTEKNATYIHCVACNF